MERKLFGHRQKRGQAKDFRQHHRMDEKVKDDPPGYEGAEHVRYEDPGYSSHDAKLPDDEPHMKSRVGKNEQHEMEDNYWMDVPKQTKKTLPAKLERAYMKMDDPDQEEPDTLKGNLVTTVTSKGKKDEDGEEEEGPNQMQKESRKKLIVAVMKRKMRKRDER
jgi:hypothetical protein